MTFLENQQGLLQTALAEQHDTFSEVASLFESYVMATQRVVDLVSRGEPIEKYEDGSINFSHYLLEHQLGLVMIDLGRWLRSLVREVHVLAVPTNDDVIVFGGG